MSRWRVSIFNDKKMIKTWNYTYLFAILGEIVDLLEQALALHLVVDQHLIGQARS